MCLLVRFVDSLPRHYAFYWHFCPVFRGTTARLAFSAPPDQYAKCATISFITKLLFGLCSIAGNLLYPCHTGEISLKTQRVSRAPERPTPPDTCNPTPHCTLWRIVFGTTPQSSIEVCPAIITCRITLQTMAAVTSPQISRVQD